MAITTPTTRSGASPAELLRTLVDVEVTVVTHEGPVTGSVLSCTRLSVWLVADDTDFVVSIDEVVDVVVHDMSEVA